MLIANRTQIKPLDDGGSGIKSRIVRIYVTHVCAHTRAFLLANNVGRIDIFLIELKREYIRMKRKTRSNVWSRIHCGKDWMLRAQCSVHA